MAPHSSFITKGDNNVACDQTSIVTDSKGNPVGPVKPEWIKGKVEFKDEIDFIFLIIIVIVAISVIIVIIIIVLFRRRRGRKNLKKGDDEDYY